MKEKRKGPIGRAAGLAEGVAATVRRMQREREPRVLVYDETGYARLVQPNGRGHERLLDTAEKMVALAATAEAAAKPRRARLSDRDTAEDAEPRRESAKPRRSETKPRRSETKPRRSETKPRRSEPKPRRSRRAAPEDDA